MDQERLIYDVGMHNCEDTAYYLHKKYSVVAIEADLQLVRKAEQQFGQCIQDRRLIILNYAISDRDDETVEFFISKNSIWSSLRPEMANRQDLQKEVVKVKTKKLSTLMKTYGTPFYCKIDIEGYDIIALKTLTDLTAFPQFISVESECASEQQRLSEEAALETLEALHALGYKRFKLVDQLTLSVLRPNEQFYRKSFFRKVLEHLRIIELGRKPINRKYRYEFDNGSTGPFGEDLEGTWLDYNLARQTLLFHRKSYFGLHVARNNGFWCDWHATL